MYWTLILLAAAALSAAPPSAFVDEFRGDALDERWRTCHWWSDDGCTIATNHELEWYRPAQVRVGGGAVRLVAERGRDPDGDRRHRFVSGMISTGPGPGAATGFAFRYGRAEMRARLPDGDGLWPAFWMLPADRRSEPEIDVLEVKSDAPRTVYGSLHFRRGGEEHTVRRARGGVGPGWHTFAVQWRPRRLRWFVDGRLVGTVRGAKVPNTPMYLVANLAVSGDPPPTAATPSPAALAIDWIRVTR